MNVLIVDDNATNRKLLRVSLEAEGINVMEAADGIEALDILDRSPTDAIISDILMPRMDGYRLCYEVRDSKRFCHLLFIIYTNTFTSPGDEKAGLGLGADSFIRKPSPVSEILVALNVLKERLQPVRSGHIPPPEGLELMKEYSETLVRKLEQKNSELQLAGEQLSQVNQILTIKSRELEQTTEELLNSNAELEKRVRERTTALQAVNRELEGFNHSVAHDLRAPLRAIDGYSRILLEEQRERLDPEGAGYLQKIRTSIGEMDQLIEDLLRLAQVSRIQIHWRRVNLSEMAQEILAKLQESLPAREVQTVVVPGLAAQGDPGLLRVVLENLLNNAWKFTGKSEQPRIEFGIKQDVEVPVHFVRDNGAGFDMAYVNKLFSPFQRLHSGPDFPGTGIGLATVQRIIHRHGGLVWAEGATGKGATFYFALGVQPTKHTE